jgi:hypothetical protein
MKSLSSAFNAFFMKNLPIKEFIESLKSGAQLHLTLMRPPVVKILLANSETLKCHPTCQLFDGTQALKQPLQKPRLGGVERGSPTVAHALASTTADEKSLAIFSRVSEHL